MKQNLWIIIICATFIICTLIICAYIVHPESTLTLTPTPTPLTTPTPALGVKIWDGTVATKFQRGSGAENDPYIITTANQLAYLAELVNQGKDSADKHYKLGADIFINDEMFEFLPDTGLLKVTDSANVGYVGTNILGDDSGDNLRFSYMASKKGAWYLSESGKSGKYTGEINEWIPIGRKGNCFKGNFDGAGHTIIGIYIATNEDYQGLFGESKGKIRNVNVSSFYIIGDEYIGGIAAHSDIGTITNCKTNGGIIGSKHLGGIAGNGKAVIDCQSSGTVRGTSFLGGIVGKGKIISNCNNYSTVIGDEYIGGITGTGSDTINYCYNSGDVIGSDFSNYIGGIVGDFAGGKISCCRNNGNVNGNTFVGGIVGYFSDGVLNDCYNSGNINSSNNINYDVGGVVGSCWGSEVFRTYIERCYTVGEVTRCGENWDVAIGCINVLANIVEVKAVYILDTEAPEHICGKEKLLPDAEMQNQFTFYGYLDFKNVWTMAGDPQYRYPELISMIE